MCECVYSTYTLLYSYDELLMDSSDEEEETKQRKPPKGRISKQKAQGRAWIKEDNEDDPVNFLDPGIVQRVIGL